MPAPAPELLSERILRAAGPVRVAQRYWRGHHPALGTLHQGLRGPETLTDTARVVALHRFAVR